MADEPQRLSKVVAALVPCSRTQAERYIEEGWVRVDGQRVDEPQFLVTPQHRVEVERNARLQAPMLATFLVHKPAGVADAQALVTAGSQWSGDASGLRLVRNHLTGLQQLMPLPAMASGLAVFSQDRRVIRKLTEDAAFVEQELVAEVRGTIAPDGLKRLGGGLVRNGKPLPPAHVSWQSETRLRFAMKGIPPDAIGWMCAQVGLELTALRRLRLGRVPMAGLALGQWRYLGPNERF